MIEGSILGYEKITKNFRLDDIVVKLIIIDTSGKESHRIVMKDYIKKPMLLFWYMI